jgi:hypothetical protein
MADKLFDSLLLLTFRAAVAGGMTPDDAAARLMGFLGAPALVPTDDEVVWLKTIMERLDGSPSLAVTETADENAPRPMPGGLYLPG